MNYKIADGPEQAGIPSGKKNKAGIRRYPVGGVSESSLPARDSDRKVGAILSDIVTRLERIEEKIDENVYPPESTIKPGFVKDIKKARSDIKKGKGKSYNSADDFFREIEA
jgi:hypothetical protein